MTELRSVAVPLLHGVAPFELGVVCEVFGVDRSAQGLPTYDFSIVAAEPGPIRTSVGFSIDVSDDLSVLEEADLVVVPARPFATTTNMSSRCWLPCVERSTAGPAS